MSGTDFNGLPPAGTLQLGDVFALQRGTGEDSTKQTTLSDIKAAMPEPSPAMSVALQMSSYTVLAADNNVYRRMSAGSTITVGPEAGEPLPDGYQQHFDNETIAALTFVAGSGVTIQPPANGSLSVPPAGVVTLIRKAENVFRLIGITEAP